MQFHHNLSIFNPQGKVFVIQFELRSTPKPSFKAILLNLPKINLISFNRNLQLSACASASWNLQACSLPRSTFLRSICSSCFLASQTFSGISNSFLWLLKLSSHPFSAASPPAFSGESGFLPAQSRAKG